jgi:uncharacterized membrane protein
MSYLEIHLAINHSPLYATLFAFFLLLTGMMIRNRSIATAGLIVTIIAALCGLAADFTGDRAADILKSGPPIAGVDTSLIKEHDQAAGWVVTSSCIAAGLAIVTLFVGRKRGQRPRWMEVVMLVVLLWSFSVVARTALLGGRIHHPEVRPVVQG